MNISAPPRDGLVLRAVRRGCETVVCELGGAEPWRPRVLAPAGRLARVALVQSRASLLAGDDVAIDIELGAGAALEIVELGATLAHHARGGAPAQLRTQARLGPGARLLWLGQPLIAAAGCSVLRSTTITLAGGAAALLGEALVLGRAGEQPGRARCHTRIELEGRPLLEETLSTGPSWLLRSSVVAGRARMIDALTLAGVRDPDPQSEALQAHGPATMRRSVGAARAGAWAAEDQVVRRWRAILLDSLHDGRGWF